MDEELKEFQELSSSLFFYFMEDTRSCSLDSLGFFKVKSLTKCLNYSTPMDRILFSAIWKSRSRSPKKVNIITWILRNGRLHFSEVL